MDTKSRGTSLWFRDLVVSIRDKKIIQCVSGVAKSGELLAVMGLTGSGKTTLLNALAGHIPLTSGEIKINYRRFSSVTRRRLGYVIQQDSFLSNLTLWETLYFTAMIQIPDNVSIEEKMSRIDDVINALDMKHCLETVVGDVSHGLSGGEKKRASIACVLLTDPDIILIDEPTSGLDSSAALKLMQQLRDYAANLNKSITVSIHQPSSQVFHMFSSLLLLADGHSVFFGEAQKVLDHFASINLVCEDNYNPADFLHIYTLSIRTVGTGTASSFNQVHLLGSEEAVSHILSSSAQLRNNVPSDDERTDTCRPETRMTGYKLFDFPIPFQSNPSGRNLTRHWPASFWTQFRMLTWRNFRQSKGRIFDKYDAIRAIVVGIVAGVLYFKINGSLDTFRDRMGIIFFCILYWGINIAKTAVVGFSEERAVINKERRAGAYRLSAFYLAKITSEVPLILFLPFVLLCFVYWMSSLGGLYGFVVFLGINVLNCLVAQSVGHIIGASIFTLDTGILTADTVMILALLLGGFYNTHFPSWFWWGKYLSVFHYPLAALVIIILGNISSMRCTSITLYDQFPQCKSNSSNILTAEDILHDAGIELPVYFYVASLCFILVVLKIVAYCVLRCRRI